MHNSQLKTTISAPLSLWIEHHAIELRQQSENIFVIKDLEGLDFHLISFSNSQVDLAKTVQLNISVKKSQDCQTNFTVYLTAGVCVATIDLDNLEVLSGQAKEPERAVLITEKADGWIDLIIEIKLGFPSPIYLGCSLGDQSVYEGCGKDQFYIKDSILIEILDLQHSGSIPKYSPIYQEIFSKLYRQDPYVGFKVESDANYRIISEQEGPDVFEYLINHIHPKLILEVGSWQGSSAIYMAQLLEKYNVEDSVIICVDTWLGSPEHWLNTASHVNDTWSYDNLKITQGFPNIYKTFLSNVINTGNQHRIIPFPQTSENAFTIFKHLGIKFDLIYLDAAHEYEIVKQELNLFSELISEQGILFGDDYGWWPGVTQAVDNFIDQHKLKGYVRTGKFIVAKPDQDLLGVEQATGATLKLAALSLESLPHFSIDDFHNPDIQSIHSCFYSFNQVVLQRDLDILIYSDTYQKNKAINLKNNPLNREYYINFNKLANLSHSYGLFKFSNVRFAGGKFCLENNFWLDDLYFSPYNAGHPAKHIINEAFILFIPDSVNYYHCMIDGILTLYYYKKLGLNCPIIFCNKSSLQNYELKCLDAIGINLDQVLLMNSELQDMQVQTAYIPNISWRTWKINSNEIKFLQKIGHTILEKYAPEDQINNHIVSGLNPKIYISRRDTLRRPLVNEAEVETFLLEEGFKIVKMSNLSFLEQILIMKNASCIVAAHGAGLVNLAFCSEGTTVIELADKENFVPIFQRIGICQKLKMFHVLGQIQVSHGVVPAGGGYNLTCGEWAIDISLLKTVLELALAKE